MARNKIIFLDWLALNLIYFLINYLVTGGLRLPNGYFKLLLLLNGSWLIFSFFEHKFTLGYVHSIADMVLKLLNVTLLMAFFVALILVGMQLGDFNRLHTLGTLGGLLFLELFFVLLYNRRIQTGMHIESRQVRARARRPYVFTVVLADLGLYLLFFYLTYYFKYDTISFDLNSWWLLSIMIGMWVFSAKWTGKFERRQHSGYFHLYEPFVKAGFILIAAAALLIYSVQIYHFSRTILFAPVLALVVAEAFLTLIWFRFAGSVKQSVAGDIEKTAQVQRFFSNGMATPPAEAVAHSARHRLKEHFLAAHPDLFDFLDRHCFLDTVPLQNLGVLDTHTPFNIQVFERESLEMFINLHRVNDFRRLNAYFLDVHGKLAPNGYFIGVMETVEATMIRLQQRFPKYMSYMLYSLDFLFRRVMPKVPGLDRVYFFFSRGLNRRLSKAELLGRLCFCGFRIQAVQHIDGELFFAARKSSEPNRSSDPSYSMLIRLKRVGFQGKTFYLYKLRTMHPYSEFLQEYIYLQNNLDESGKFKDDFRVAGWGKVLRTLWLDELPQLINWLRGDVKIVGARALSEHYYSLYPDDLQQLRNRFKPGLVPPYYADLPKSMAEIVESERRYFQAKLEHPVRTDWIYLGRAMYNIIVKHARSQ